MSPERGPATNTMAMLDLLRPRDIKYGDAGSNSIHSSCLSAEHRRTVGHLNTPEYLNAEQTYGYGRQICPSWSQYSGCSFEFSGRLALFLGLRNGGKASHGRRQARTPAPVHNSVPWHVTAQPLQPNVAVHTDPHLAYVHHLSRNNAERDKSTIFTLQNTRLRGLTIELQRRWRDHVENSQSRVTSQAHVW